MKCIFFGEIFMLIAEIIQHITTTDAP